MSWMMLKKTFIGLASCFSSCAGFILLIALIGRLTHSGLLGMCGPYGSDTATSIMLLLVPIGLLASSWIGLYTRRKVGGSKVAPAQVPSLSHGMNRSDTPLRSIDSSITRKLEEDPFE
jgi:hypothetical protein